jgi:hypothetical protein
MYLHGISLSNRQEGQGPGGPSGLQIRYGDISVPEKIDFYTFPPLFSSTCEKIPDVCQIKSAFRASAKYARIPPNFHKKSQKATTNLGIFGGGADQDRTGDLI